MTVRVIPRLDIKRPNLVKGVHLEGLRVLGKPEDFARHYYEQGADELLYTDVIPSSIPRKSIGPTTGRKCWSPSCLGTGGRGDTFVNGKDGALLERWQIGIGNIVERSLNYLGVLRNGTE